MDRTEMILSNRGLRKTFLFSLISCVVSAVAGWFLSGEIAKRIVREQISFAFHVLGGGKFMDAPAPDNVRSGEALFSDYGITRDMDPNLFDIFPKIRLELFGCMFFLCLAAVIIVTVSAVFEQLRVCRQLEEIRNDCTQIADQIIKSSDERGEELSCVRRVSDGVNLIAKRLSYLNELLTDERDLQKEFLTDFSHQMKNSLAVVRLNTDMLTEMEFSKEKRDSLTNETMSHLDGMEEMVISALRLAKLNAGAVVYEKEEKDFAETCKEAIKRVTPLFREKGISMKTDFSEKVFLNHDRMWLCEAVENLLANSAEHGECTCISMSLKNISGAVKLIISDNGKGISQSEIPHLFDRFQKKDRGTGHNFGVGMDISKKVIEAHQGSISVYSEKENGTEFEIVFLK